MHERKHNTYNAGVIMWVAFIHLHILAADAEEAEVAIIMADRINSKMPNPPGIFQPLAVTAVASGALAAAVLFH